MFMQLGTIVFEPLPITGMSEEYTYDYPEHAVIEGKPLLQYIGDQLDITDLTIRLHTSFCDPPTAFAQIKAVADSHQAQRLVAGDGTIYGLRVITRLSKTLVKTADNGRPILIEAQLALKEWVDTNPLGSKQAAQQKSAPGLQGKGPIGKVTAQDRGQVIMVAGMVKTGAVQIKQSAKKLPGLAGLLPAGLSDIAAQVTTAAGQIQAAIAPIMQQAQTVASGVQGAASALQGQIAAVSGLSSDIARITSGLPYPASLIGNRIAAINRQISAQAVQGITLTSLVQGNAIEAGTRALMITRMLPGGR